MTPPPPPVKSIQHKSEKGQLVEGEQAKILSPIKESKKLIDMSMEEDKDMGEGEDEEEMMLDEENAIDEAFEPDLNSNIPLT